MPIGRHAARSGSLRLLTVVVGFVLAVLGLALTAGPAAAGNVVGPQPIFSILTVGPHDAAGQERVGAHGPPLRQPASATGVAAKTGTSALEALSPTVRANVDDAIQRAAAGKIRFTGHDGKVYNKSDGLLPRGGNYTEWTAAQAGAKRGADRVIIDGDPANPTAIYYWDHINPPVRIGP